MGRKETERKTGRVVKDEDDGWLNRRKGKVMQRWLLFKNGRSIQNGHRFQSTRVK